MNKITNKWEQSGLLRNLSRVDKNKLANLLENMVNILISKMDVLKSISTEKCYDQLMPSCIIPIVVRLYHINPKKMPDMEWLFYDFLDYVKKNWDKYTEDCVNKIDGEAELCSNYSDNFFKLNVK